MKCDECLALLEEHADGEARASDAARVEAHLEVCAACARERRRLDEERAVFLTYECDAAPAEGFWDEVLSKIEAEAGARAASSSAPFARPDSKAAQSRSRLGAALGMFAAPRLSPALVAALLVVAVGATVAVMKYSAQREAAFTRETAETVAPQNADDATDGRSASSSSSNRGGAAVNVDESAAGKNKVGAGGGQKVEQNAARDGRREVADVRAGVEERSVRRGVERSVRVKNVAVAESASSSQESAPDRLVREAEQKYLAAIRLLSRDVSGRRARLDADARARFEQTLAAVNRTIADTRRAAREHPRDPVAVQYMLTAYAKKVELLREMARN